MSERSTERRHEGSPNDIHFEVLSRTNEVLFCWFLHWPSLPYTKHLDTRISIWLQTSSNRFYSFLWIFYYSAHVNNTNLLKRIKTVSLEPKWLNTDIRSTNHTYDIKPIIMHLSYVQQWKIEASEKFVSRFIWQDSVPRIKYKILWLFFPNGLP